jgi:hypothetical protein
MQSSQSHDPFSIPARRMDRRMAIGEVLPPPLASLSATRTGASSSSAQQRSRTFCPACDDGSSVRVHGRIITDREHCVWRGWTGWAPPCPTNPSKSPQTVAGIRPVQSSPVLPPIHPRTHKAQPNKIKPRCMLVNCDWLNHLSAPTCLRIFVYVCVWKFRNEHERLRCPNACASQQYIFEDCITNLHMCTPVTNQWCHVEH